MGIVKGHKIKDIVTSPFYSLKPLGFPQLLASRKWRLLLYHLMRSNNILCSCWCNFQVIPATTMSLAARKRARCNNKTGVSTAQLVWCISSYRHLSKAAEASASPESPCGSSGRAGPRNMLFRIIYMIMLKVWSLSFCFPIKIWFWSELSDLSSIFGFSLKVFKERRFMSALRAVINLIILKYLLLLWCV